GYVGGDDVEAAELNDRGGAGKLGGANGDDAFFAGQQREIVVIPEDRDHVGIGFSVGEPQANLEGHAVRTILKADVSRRRGTHALDHDNARFQIDLAQRAQAGQVAKFALRRVNGVLLFRPVQSIGFGGKPVKIVGNGAATGVAQVETQE